MKRLLISAATAAAIFGAAVPAFAHGAGPATPGFEPGDANCVGAHVSAAAHEYGSFKKAADAHDMSVKEAHQWIKDHCAEEPAPPAPDPDPDPGDPSTGA